MTTRVLATGRRFTKRAATIHETPDGETWLLALDPDESFTAGTIARHKATAIEALEAAGIPTQAILAEHPGGSMLRDRVMNYLDHEPDSLLGLAARIVEVCIRVEVLGASAAPVAMQMGAAYRLGRLVMIARAYGIEAVQRAAASAAPRPGRRDPLRAALVESFRRERRKGRTLLEALKSLEGNLHGLRVESLDGAMKWRVIDETPTDGKPVAGKARTAKARTAKARTYAVKALETIWTEAGKAPRKR